MIWIKLQIVHLFKLGQMETARVLQGLGVPWGPGPVPPPSVREQD